MIFTSAVEVNPFDGPEWADIIGQFATLVGVVLVGFWAHRAKRDSKATLHQVKNDHKTNLRDNIDKLEGKLDRLDRGQVHIITEVGLLKSGWLANRTDIDHLLEDTEARESREQQQWGPPQPGSRRARRNQ